MNSKKLTVVLLSDLQYPKGELDSYIFAEDRKRIISELYDKGIFVWDDFVDVMAPDYKPPEPYYKLKTGRTARPYIPLNQEDFSYLISEKGKNDTEITYTYLTIKQLLTSRQFAAARKVLPILGKLNKQDYSIYEEPCPNCILLKHFKIEKPDDERSFKIAESTHN